MKKNVAVITMLLVGIFQSQASQYYLVNRDQINIRADSTIASPSLGLLSKNTQVEVVQKTYDWYEIKLPKYFKAYVWGTYIKRLSRLRGEVLASRLNMRQHPSLESPIIGQLSQETIVIVKDKTGDWLQISAYPFATGWVHEKFLSPQMLEESEEKEALLWAFISKSFEALSTANKSEKEQIIGNIIDKGQNTITLIEMHLDPRNKTLTYDIINIFTQLAKDDSALISYFLKKSESTSLLTSSIYLDVLQNTLEVEGEKIAYYYLAKQGKLSKEKIDKIREKYREIHEKNILSRGNNR